MVIRISLLVCIAFRNFTSGLELRLTRNTIRANVSSPALQSPPADLVQEHVVTTGVKLKSSAAAAATTTPTDGGCTGTEEYG